MVDFKKALEKKHEPVIEYGHEVKSTRSVPIETNRSELKKAIGLLECTLRFEPLDKHLRQTVKDFIKEMKDKGIKGAF